MSHVVQGSNRVVTLFWRRRVRGVAQRGKCGVGESEWWSVKVGGGGRHLYVGCVAVHRPCNAKVDEFQLALS